MRLRHACLVISLLGLWGCGAGDPDVAQFKGTWKHTLENGIAMTKTEEVVTASVDRKKFRIVTRIPSQESIEVFDGDTLFTKNTSFPVDAEGNPLDEAQAQAYASSGPSEYSRQVKDYEMGPLRFWSHGTSAHGEPGGLVANQQTVLTQVGERRPDGELSRQSWVDAKTGVVLKRIDTIYSSQVRSIVTQETWECQSIEYGPVDDAAFRKP